MTLHKLQDNGGGDDGAIGITEALVSSLTLRWVYLDGNSITDQGGKVSPATVGTLCYCYCLLLTAYCYTMIVQKLITVIVQQASCNHKVSKQCCRWLAKLGYCVANDVGR
jgi:hypothetical protein